MDLRARFHETGYVTESGRLALCLNASSLCVECHSSNDKAQGMATSQCWVLLLQYDDHVGQAVGESVLTKHTCGNVLPVKTWLFAWRVNF
jgi:hypothetical protein